MPVEHYEYHHEHRGDAADCAKPTMWVTGVMADEQEDEEKVADVARWG